VVAARRRKAKKKGEHWGRRLGGLVVLAFFIFGMIAGVSAPGRSLFARLDGWSAGVRTRLDFGLARLVATWTGGSVRAAAAGGGAPIVLVERWNGFYTLSEPGELNGPISPGAQGDLPILSGPAVASAGVDDLLEYATLLVRAEATLSVMISEMRVDNDGVATLYLNRTRTELAIDVDSAPLELRRAGEVLDRWHGREDLIAALDMTTPAQAVLRMRVVAPATSAHVQRTSAVAAGAPRDEANRWSSGR